MSPIYSRLTARERFDNFVATRGGAIWVAVIGAVVYAVGLGLALASPLPALIGG